MNVLIIESAAKGKTLQKYLGGDWAVVATGGHVETLPNDRKKYGKDATKAYWANRTGELPSPPWVWTDRGEKAVENILEAGGDEPVFWIATDPDREGEFIAWSLEKHLEAHGPTHRVTFQEITEEALFAALDRPRRTDRRMVESALLRKFVDRLVGFRASKMASGVVGRGASMGRVQTPALGFVVEKELEREAFVPTPFFEVRVTAGGQGLGVVFHERGSADVWRDDQGRSNRKRTFDGDDARAAFDALSAASSLTLTRATRRKPTLRRPAPAFSTDALLQEAGSRFGWTPGKTSALASMLYEAGHITYIRTDSTRLAASAVQALRGAVTKEFGAEELGGGSGDGGGGAGGTGAAGGAQGEAGAQDAHEAIRPTRCQMDEVPLDDADARKLYRLIRARALATQMRPAVIEGVDVEARCVGTDFPLTTRISWHSTLGWERAWAEFQAAPRTAPPELPLEEGGVWEIDAPGPEEPNPVLIEDETSPPSRLTQHGLIKRMKEAGIGRPSTYARTVEKLLERTYLEMEGSSLVPTSRGRAAWLEVAPLYAADGDGDADGADDGADRTSDFFDARYTELMESGLDEVAAGGVDAAARWESWRDEFRDRHELARDRKKSGQATPSQRKMIARLLANAPAGVPSSTDLDNLSWQGAKDLIDNLRESGVQPAPTEAQMDYLARLVEDLRLPEDELEEALGAAGVEELKTAEAVSQALDRLRQLADERKPPSAKQRRYVEDLAKELELDEAAAAALVGVASFDELTGGSEGTASALIDLLVERQKAAG